MEGLHYTTKQLNVIYSFVKQNKIHFSKPTTLKDLYKWEEKASYYRSPYDDFTVENFMIKRLVSALFEGDFTLAQRFIDVYETTNRNSITIFCDLI